MPVQAEPGPGTVVAGGADVWTVLSPWLEAGRPKVVTSGDSPVYWRRLWAGRRPYLLLVSVGKDAPESVSIGACGRLSVVSPPEAILRRTAGGYDLAGIGAYALLAAPAVLPGRNAGR